MVGIALSSDGAAGLGAHVVLVLCRRGGLKENRIIYTIVSAFVNVVRSVPFVILLVTIMPLTRAVVGTTMEVRRPLCR